MTQASNYFRQAFPVRAGTLVVVALAISLAGIIGSIAVNQPILPFLAYAAVILLATIFSVPEVVTLGVIFAIFSNAVVVGVRFHGVPYIVGLATPAALAFPLIIYLFFKRQKVIIDPAAVLLFLFVIVQSLGAFSSKYVDISFNEMITLATEGLALYILLLNTVRTLKMARLAIWTLLAAGAFLGSLSIYQQATQTFDKNYWGFAQMSQAAFGTGVEALQGTVMQPRLAGPLGDQNYYAQYMLMLVPLGLFRIWGEKSWWLRILAFVLMILTAAGVALTFSRGAAVGFALVIGIMLFLRYIKWYQFAAVLIGVLIISQAFPQYTKRLSTLSFLSQGDSGISQADTSTKSRLTEMGTAALVFADHPILGVGPGMFKYYYQDYSQEIGLKLQTTVRAAHDAYLGIAADNGVLGLLCFLGILVVTLRSLALTRNYWLHKDTDTASMAIGWFLSVVTFMATGIFLSLAYDRYFYMMIALANAFVFAAGQAATLNSETAQTEKENFTDYENKT